MLAKRDLIQIGEGAISRATHNLDVSTYYSGISDGSGSVTFSGTNSASGTTSALPIDCHAAYQTFTQQISQASLRSHPIGFTEWNCDGYAASAKIESQIEHLLRIPFISDSPTFTVAATISAVNRLQ